MIDRQELVSIGLTGKELALAADQTALAADSMSTTISTIRTDTQAVADDIFEELSRLVTSPSDFVSKFAARMREGPRG